MRSVINIIVAAALVVTIVVACMMTGVSLIKRATAESYGYKLLELFVFGAGVLLEILFLWIMWKFLTASVRGCRFIGAKIVLQPDQIQLVIGDHGAAGRYEACDQKCTAWGAIPMKEVSTGIELVFPLLVVSSRDAGEILKAYRVVQHPNQKAEKGRRGDGKRG